MARVIGIDPGLHRTGYGVLDASSRPARLLEAGLLRPGAKGSLPDRLATLFDGAAGLFAEHPGSTVAVEDLFSHYARPKTAILMGHARGVLLLAAARADLAVASYLPTRVKKTMTGNGHASKAQIQRAVQAEFGLERPIEPADVADALAIALTHAATKTGPAIASR